VTENGETVTEETILIPVDILGHWERINFNVIKTSTYDAVLGLPWLEKHNPTINYRERTLTFNGYGCKLIKDIDISEILMRAMNAYYRQDPNQIYLAMMIVKRDESSFTVS
jgi:hypothetical protein